MRARFLVFAVFALGAWIPISVAGNSPFSLDLGLDGEYVNTSQEVNGETSGTSSLRAGINAAFSGFVLDPRFFVFDGSLRFTTTRLESEKFADQESKQTGYRLGFRAFSNRKCRPPILDRCDFVRSKHRSKSVKFLRKFWRTEDVVERFLIVDR